MQAKLVLLCALVLVPLALAGTPPVAKKEPVAREIHGDRLVDDYHWLRDKTNPEVIKHLEAENAYTSEMMKPTAALQKRLYDEMLGRIQQTDSSPPYRYGEFHYYTRWEKGKQYPIHCRHPNADKKREIVLLDVNELAKEHAFFAVRGVDVNDDGTLLAYTSDSTGFRQYRLHIKDLKSGKLLADTAERVVSFAWATDGRHYFYVTEDPVTKNPNQLFRRELGGEPVLVYEEKDERFRIAIDRTRSRGFLLLVAESKNENETRYLSAAQPKEEWKLIFPRRDNHQYFVDHRGSDFYIQTNDRGLNFRLAKVPVTSPGADWKEILPLREKVVLESFSLFAHHAVLFEREGGLPQITVLRLDTGTTHRVSFPEPTYHVRDDENPEFDTKAFRYAYESLVSPRSIFEYDMDAKASKLLKQDKVKGYVPSRYRSEWIFAPAKDGTRVPVSIVYRRSLVRNGRAPLLLQGYGSYGIPRKAGFSNQRVSLLDRGMVFAIAHIRGGGEMGRQWYEDGKLMRKRNSFSDFIDVAEHLVAQKFTSPSRLAIQGISAGGLLMGAVTNARPDLFKVVLTDVPFVDAVNTMLDSTIPLTVAEYKEWGNPNQREDYLYIKSYCPYTNLERKAYPAMLVTTALNDSQVMYWEPAKYVAKLRAHKTDSNPLLFKVNLSAGHSGPSGRYNSLKEDAFQYAFLITQLGITR